MLMKYIYGGRHAKMMSIIFQNDLLFFNTFISMEKGGDCQFFSTNRGILCRNSKIPSKGRNRLRNCSNVRNEDPMDMSDFYLITFIRLAIAVMVVV